MTDGPSKTELLELTTEIVAAHAGNNTVSPEELSRMINDVFNTLANVGEPTTSAQRAKPAVPVKKSVFPDYLVCLEDGRKLKMLKRHLNTAYGMTPDEYRAKWGLSADYPMVAPNYAKKRSTLAKKIGLGTKPRRPTKKGKR
ncbi:MAG: MucR family transcriptional regulator [Rhodospirillales bacterium]